MISVILSEAAETTIEAGEPRHRRAKDRFLKRDSSALPQNDIRWSRSVLARAVSLVLFTLCSLPAAHAMRVSVVLDEITPQNRPIVNALKRFSTNGDRVTVHVMRSADLSNPIEKGRFLAPVFAADLVVPVGDASAAFVSAEVSRVPVYFVGVGLLRGTDLAAEPMTGILAYNVKEILEVIRSLPAERLGIAYVRGYERILPMIRAEAQAQGIALVEKRIRNRSEIAPAYQSLLAEVQAIWVLGDPLLSRGAGLEYLIEQSLSRKIPVAGTTAFEVERGALFFQRPDPLSLANSAASGLQRLIGREVTVDKLSISPAPAGGRIVVNEVLARKWQMLLQYTNP